MRTYSELRLERRMEIQKRPGLARSCATATIRVEKASSLNNFQGMARNWVPNSYGPNSTRKPLRKWYRSS